MILWEEIVIVDNAVATTLKIDYETSGFKMNIVPERGAFQGNKHFVPSSCKRIMKLTSECDLDLLNELLHQ